MHPTVKLNLSQQLCVMLACRSCHWSAERASAADEHANQQLQRPRLSSTVQQPQPCHRLETQLESISINASTAAVWAIASWEGGADLTNM